MFDLERITDLQMELLTSVDVAGLKPIEKVKYGKMLVSNYKKAQAIIKSGTDHAQYWTKVLEIADRHINELLEDLEKQVYIANDLSQNAILGFVDIVTSIKYLDYENAMNYGGVDEEKIDLSLYEDILE